MTLGERLKELRTIRSMTLEQVAETMGMSAALTVWRWEAGEREPQLARLAALAKVYGVTLIDLLAPVEFEAFVSTKDVLPFGD